MLSRIEQNELGWRLLSVIRRKNPYCTAISPYRLGTVDGIAKKNLPGKLFFLIIYQFLCIVHTYFVPRGITIYR
jgi:hypothetical protein